jgi:hypothetical protein
VSSGNLKGALIGAVTGAFSRTFNDEIHVEEERTWSSYLPGAEAGESAVLYWAGIAVNSEHLLAFAAHVPGVFASMRTDQTAVSTTFTLGTAGTGTDWRLGLKGGSRSVLWSGDESYSCSESWHHTGNNVCRPACKWLNRRRKFFSRKFWGFTSKTLASNAKGVATKVGAREGYFWRTFEPPGSREEQHSYHCRTIGGLIVTIP